jgi:hypothetical protein
VQWLCFVMQNTTEHMGVYNRGCSAVSGSSRCPHLSRGGLPEPAAGGGGRWYIGASTGAACAFVSFPAGFATGETLRGGEPTGLMWDGELLGLWRCRSVQSALPAVGHLQMTHQSHSVWHIHGNPYHNCGSAAH